MLSAVPVITFLATAVILMALVYAFTPGESGVTTRLKQLMNATPRSQEEKFVAKQKERARSLLAQVGALLPAAAGKRANRAQLMMIRAGYRSSDAVLAIRGMKVLAPVVLVAMAFFSGVYRYSPFSIFLGAVILGLLLPEMWL